MRESFRGILTPTRSSPGRGGSRLKTYHYPDALSRQVDTAVIAALNECPPNGKRWLVWFDRSGQIDCDIMNPIETFCPSPREAPRCGVCPLSRVQTGVAVRIKQLCAAPEVQNRLREIGLGEAQIVKLITSRNNFICQVCNARFALSEQLAQMILVEPVVLRVS